VYTVDLADDPVRDLAMLAAEIEAYDPSLAMRSTLVVGTKADLLPAGARPAAGVDVAVAAVTGLGIDVLASRLAALVTRARTEEPARRPFVVVRPGRQPFTVRREAGRFRVAGPRVERWVAEADLDDEREVAALQRRLKRAGVERMLAEAGARRGDEIVIGPTAFEFLPEAEPAGHGEDGERGRDEA
jgi:GTP-binding protein